jgi:hypothetical protein
MPGIASESAVSPQPQPLQTGGYGTDIRGLEAGGVDGVLSKEVEKAEEARGKGSSFHWGEAFRPRGESPPAPPRGPGSKDKPRGALR